jgi:hypothetical protein
MSRPAVHLCASDHAVFPFNELTRACLLLGLGIDAGGFEKHEEVMAWSGLLFSQLREQ